MKTKQRNKTVIEFSKVEAIHILLAHAKAMPHQDAMLGIELTRSKVIVSTWQQENHDG